MAAILARKPVYLFTNTNFDENALLCGPSRPQSRRVPVLVDASQTNIQNSIKTDDVKSDAFAIFSGTTAAARPIATRARSSKSSTRSRRQRRSLVAATAATPTCPRVQRRRRLRPALRMPARRATPRTRHLEATATTQTTTYRLRRPTTPRLHPPTTRHRHRRTSRRRLRVPDTSQQRHRPAPTTAAIRHKRRSCTRTAPR